MNLPPAEIGAPVDDIRTSSTSYTALKTYNSATTIYWRVQPEDENNIGLTWSVESFAGNRPSWGPALKHPATGNTCVLVG